MEEKNNEETLYFTNHIHQQPVPPIIGMSYEDTHSLGMTQLCFITQG